MCMLLTQRQARGCTGVGAIGALRPTHTTHIPHRMPYASTHKTPKSELASRLHSLGIFSLRTSSHALTATLRSHTQPPHSM